MAHHRRGLRRLLGDPEAAERIVADYASADLGPARLAMLRYVEKLTRAPASVEEADVEALRAAGWSDEDVLHIAETAAYYAYVNRIAQGLGVRLEEGRAAAGG